MKLNVFNYSSRGFAIVRLIFLLFKVYTGDYVWQRLGSEAWHRICSQFYSPKLSDRNDRRWGYGTLESGCNDIVLVENLDQTNRSEKPIISCLC